jgi:hypothetical protein
MRYLFLFGYRQSLLCLVGNFSSINHWITSLTPNPLIIIHHQMDDRGHHLPHDFSTLGYLAAVDVAVPGSSTGLIKLFAKNSPEGFGIYRFTRTGEVLPQCIVDECLIWLLQNNKYFLFSWHAYYMHMSTCKF